MCTSTVAAADALPGQPETVIGDSTVERSGIGTSVVFVAAHPAGPGNGVGEGDGVVLGVGVGVGGGDGVGLGVAVGVGLGDGVGLGVGLGDGVGLGVGVGVALGSTVNDRVFVDEAFHARSRACIEKVYEPAASPL